MEINATIFVQAVNFLITYYMFRQILLKPAYKEFCAERDIEFGLQENIEVYKRSLLKEKGKQEKAWQAFAEWCKQAIPKKEAITLCKSTRTQRAPHNPTQQEIATARNQLGGLIARIFRDRYE